MVQRKENVVIFMLQFDEETKMNSSGAVVFFNQKKKQNERLM